jgi:hypothetical protein
MKVCRLLFSCTHAPLGWKALPGSSGNTGSKQASRWKADPPERFLSVSHHRPAEQYNLPQYAAPALTFGRA